MGYTHYYSVSGVSQTKWNGFINNVKIMFSELPKHSESSGGPFSDSPLYLSGCSRHRSPVFDSEQILFNGSSVTPNDRTQDSTGCFEGDELDHETFYMTPDCEEFCKTARKPYDLMVQGCLILAKKHFGDKCTFSSDGGFKDWEVAYKFVSDLFPNFDINKKVLNYIKEL